MSMTTNATLPTETILEIFHPSLLRHRLDEEGRLGFQAIRSVCPRWRSISFSSPSLWSCLSVTCKIDDSHIAQLPRIERWFSFSGSSVPLELEFKYEEFSDDSMLSQDKVAMSALIQRYQPRWRYLSLSIEPKCFWDSILPPTSTNWASLHTLKLCVYDFVDLPPERHQRALEVLANITSLQCLLLEDDNEYLHQTNYGPVNMAELHITLDQVFKSDLIHIISRYNHLTKLTLIAPQFQEFGLKARDRLTLPSLLTFSFTTDNLTLLAHLFTPALVDLELHERALAPFLARCSALRSITLSDEFFISKALPILAAQPSFTQIKLDMWPLATTLNITEDAPEAWCPNVRELHVSMGTEGTPRRLESSRDVEVHRLWALSLFLLQWQDRGRAPLERLIVHKLSGGVDFPYGLFSKVHVGELRIVNSW
ncbi:hypothetical protein BKA70DRAFT_1334747 [Coprinopsis sp. MPI-PUGE-AT-0042]|nr:hypothetical protein BKA70DRAFT_1334747 [Coprinopsis sp. MPI-PUGE-AT-0042]